jgi:hypothetical protein
MTNVVHYKCDFSQMTHVIIETGYAPHLANLMGIEEVLRGEFDAPITCLFANDPYWHLGITIPSPFGFESHTTIKPRSPSQVIECVNRMMATQVDHPFYQQVKTTVANKITDLNQSHPDLYDDLYTRVDDWSLKPISPDSVLDHVICEQMVNTGGEDVLYCANFAEEGDEPLMSYNERLKETIRVVNLMGGLGSVSGTLCFKLSPNHHQSPSEILEIIKKNDLSYCASFGLEGFACVSDDQMKILVLKYDAEYG